MTKPNTRIAVVQDLQPSPAPPLGHGTESGGFADWQSIRLDDAPLAPLFYRTSTESGQSLTPDLIHSRALGYPLYLEYDNQTLTRIRVPKVGRVCQFSDLGDGRYLVSLSSSSKAMTISPTIVDAARIIEVCRTSFVKQIGIVLIDEADAPDVVDADVAKGLSLNWVRNGAVVEGGGEPESLGGISRGTADKAFRDLAGRICNLTLGADAMQATDCVPFNYPDDGCQARAEVMFRALAARHIPARKVWLLGDLRLKTDNAPRCVVGWTWHVAVGVQVQDDGPSKPFVIDPCASKALLAQEDWVALFGAGVRSRRTTDGSPYRIDVDNAFVAAVQGELEGDLANARWALSKRRPPYPCH